MLAGLNNLAVTSTCEGNHPAYRAIVGIEAHSGFSFQPSRWLADVSPQLLDPQLSTAIANAKRMADRRRDLEAGLPPGLRFMKGWPPRVPDLEEARKIHRVRSALRSTHGLTDHWPNPGMIRERFAELHAAKAA